MNPSIFHLSNVGEDPQEFFDGVYNVLNYMGVKSLKKEESSSYQLRDVSQVWYTQLNDIRPVEFGFY